MPAVSPIKEVLEAIGLAICREMVRLLNEGTKYPLRKNSALAQQLLSGQAVKVSQGRTAGGQFAGYNADSTLEIFALDYLQWVDTGRKPLARKVPIAALLLFIKQRNLRGRNKTTGQYFTSNQLAWMIQTSIYKRGIRGRHVIAPAFELGQQLTDIYLNNALLDSLTYELDRQVNFL